MQFHEFPVGHLAILPQADAADANRSETNPFELHHFVADTSKQTSDFPILPFGHRDLDPGALTGFLDRLDSVHPEFAFREEEPLFECFEGLPSRLASHLGLVIPIDPVLGVCEFLGKIAVIGHDQQSGGIFIESADCEQPRSEIREQIDHSPPALRIAVSAEEAGWLVQHVVFLPFHPERFTIERNDLRLRLHPHPQHICYRAIDRHATSRDQFLAFTPRA
jgi:hypothetical protein